MIRLQQVVAAQAKQILRDDDKIAGVTRDLILSFESRVSRIFLLTYERKLFGLEDFDEMFSPVFIDVELQIPIGRA